MANKVSKVSDIGIDKEIGIKIGQPNRAGP